MLSSRPRDHGRHGDGDPRSLRREYHEFLLQRIEEYKNSLGRREILAIGDEAVLELDQSTTGQYVLTVITSYSIHYTKLYDTHCPLAEAESSKQEPCHA